MLETIKRYAVAVIDGDVLDEFETLEEAEKFKGDSINYEIVEFEYDVEYIVLSNRIDHPELAFNSDGRKFDTLEEAKEYAGYGHNIYQVFYASDSGDLAGYWEA